MTSVSSKPISDARIRAAYAQVGSVELVYEQLRSQGVKRNRIRKVCWNPTGLHDVESVSGVPDENVPMVELHRRKYEDFQRLQSSRKKAQVRTIRLKTNEPIAIGWMGDTHLDDDGCNLKKVHEDAAVIRKTNGLYAVSVGDHLNLWVGRLFKLYAEQGTKRSDGYRLLKDLIQNRVTLEKWLAIIFGNHDIWAGDGVPPLDWAQDRGIVVGKYNVRLRLIFPNGRETYVWLRHDFPGNSQWNDLHGLTKEALLGSPFHLFVAGHKHSSGYHTEFNERNGMYWHALRVGSYKEVDDYPEELGLTNKNNFQCPVTIIDPKATNDLQLIKFEPDLVDGADRLNWLRKRRGK